jgi:hypothetical protein
MVRIKNCDAYATTYNNSEIIFLRPELGAEGWVVWGW